MTLILFFMSFKLWAQEPAAGWYLKQCQMLKRDVSKMMVKARRCKTDRECFLTNEVSDRYTCCQFDVISRKAKIEPIKKKIKEMENLNCPGPQDCPCEDWTKRDHDIVCRKKTCVIRPKSKKST